MTEKQARYIQIQTKIDLLYFSLSQTKNSLHQIQINQSISKLLMAQDAL